jgi:hypothetical protein
MSYNHLLSMVKAERESERLQYSQTPVYCPNDGTTLERGPHNELHCPFDGWIWDGSPGIGA